MPPAAGVLHRTLPRPSTSASALAHRVTLSTPPALHPYRQPHLHPLNRLQNHRCPRLPPALSTMSTIAKMPSSNVEPTSPIERAKRLAAQRAVRDHLPPTAHYVGIGSGSTVVYVVEAIAALPPAITSTMIFVPTGYQSRELIVEAGLNLGAIDSLLPVSIKARHEGHEGAVGRDTQNVATGKQDLGLRGERAMLDVSFDGADEVDEQLNCIKGGGACLLQEKLVATSCRKFICVADSRKYNPRLLTSYPTIPIEVVPPCAPSVLRTLKLLGSPTPFMRLGGKSKAGPIVTDNGNFIVDAPFPKLSLKEDEASGTDVDGEWTVAGLARRLKLIVGVVETGIFTGRNGDEVARAVREGREGEGEGGGQKPVAAYFGTEDGEVFVRTAEDVEAERAKEVTR